MKRVFKNVSLYNLNIFNCLHELLQKYFFPFIPETNKILLCLEVHYKYLKSFKPLSSIFFVIFDNEIPYITLLVKRLIS